MNLNTSNKKVQVIPYIEKQLASLLRLVDLEVNGNPIVVDGLRLRKKPLKTYNLSVNKNLFCQDILAMRRFEPRIELLSLQIKSILKLVEMFSSGNTITPTSFRLKKLSQWATGYEHNKDPYFAVLKYLSWPCRTNCEFCLHKGDPPGYYTKSPYGWKTHERELETRLKYWVPGESKALPAKSEYNYFEILTHPKFREIAQSIRDKTNNTFYIVTSGSNLNNDMINYLASVEPVFLGISLNSNNKYTRQKIMRDRKPYIAINSIPYLQQKNISFFISLVAWDTIQIDDLIQTIQWVDQFEPYFIRINLDAHTRFSPIRRDVKSSMSKWKEIISVIKGYRKRVSTPILFQPALVEEKFFMRKRNRVIIEGVIKNSPAWEAGLRSMDELISINGIPTAFRPFARQLLKALSLANIKEFRLEFMRDGKIYNGTIQDTGYCYPYKSMNGPIFSPYGISVRGGLDVNHILQIEEIARAHGAKNILFLTSCLVEPLFKELIKDAKLLGFENLKLFLEIPKNKSFLGGDIILGDLLVVDDFIHCISSWVERTSMRPDLVIIPSTPFTQWGRDLTGKTYLEIERKTGISTELLYCDRIESIN